MDEELRLTDEKKEQLLRRVKECLDNNVLNLVDWMKIYDVLLEACDREAIAVQEEYMRLSVEGGGEGC